MTDIRPPLDNVMLDIARLVAQRSTCPEAHVGAVIATQDGRILSFGYNGVPRGMRHCDEDGCVKDESDHHLYVVHAELNAIINAAREGISIKDAVIYCTRFPCTHCAISIAQAGIIKVIHEEDLSPATLSAMKVFVDCHVGVLSIKYRGYCTKGKHEHSS